MRNGSVAPAESGRLLGRALSSRHRTAVLGALIGPFAITLVLVPFRDSFANTNAALILVLAIVAVAATGNRFAGALGALSAAVWFDLFLTRPFGRLTIADRADLETTALLLAVGVGVTELAAWGHRQRARADRDAGYLAGIQAAAEAVAAGRSSGDLIDEVSRQLTRVLGLRASRFQYGVAGLGHPARLRDDGQVEWQGVMWDVEQRGLPVDTDIELLVENGGRLQGRFLLSAGSELRPSLAQRLVAVTLAAQVGSSLR
jgi:K+-sensing histidine kinase KdpD